MTTMTIKGSNGITSAYIDKLFNAELDKSGIVLLKPSAIDDDNGIEAKVIVVNVIYTNGYNCDLYYRLGTDLDNDDSQSPTITVIISGDRDTMTIKYKQVINSIIYKLGFRLRSGHGGPSETVTDPNAVFTRKLLE